MWSHTNSLCPYVTTQISCMEAIHIRMSIRDYKTVMISYMIMIVMYVVLSILLLINGFKRIQPRLHTCLHNMCVLNLRVINILFSVHRHTTSPFLKSIYWAIIEGVSRHGHSLSLLIDYQNVDLH